jgi:hypothetical protein
MKRLKHDEITEPGFYWCFDDREWIVVKYFIEYGTGQFFLPGNECEVFGSYMDGPFFGPLEPPA